VTAISAAPPADEEPSLTETLRRLTGDRHALVEWLRGFDDPERCAEVARRSYWHFNGFAKLVLEVNPGHKVRLHVWPAGRGRLGESNPHGHRWNFVSMVLCGEGLHDTHYVESASGVPFGRYQYVGGNAAGALTHVGNVHLTERDKRTVCRHERYAVDTSVVHTVQPLGESLLATLVVQSPPRLASAVVYGKPGVDVDEPGRAISADEVRDLIRRVLDALDG
jgi:hypothetical protein